MKKLFLLLFLLLELGAKDIINLATVPWRSEGELINMYQPLIKLIEKSTKKKVNFLVTKDYSELSKRIKAKSVDIAIFGANSYIDAKEDNPHLIYLATSMQPNDHYNSLIIARKDSNLKKLEDLKGKNFAFTDRGSTSGYVYPNLMLNEAGIEPKKYFKTVSMLKKHYRVYDSVANGSIDAGGCSSTIYNEAIKKNGDIYTIVKRSAPIPQDPIVASGDLDKELIKTLQKSFKKANKSGLFKKYNTHLKGLSVKSDSYYDIVRKAKKFMNR